MESITRKGWTTKTNLTSPKTNLALEQCWLEEPGDMLIFAGVNLGFLLLETRT